MKKVQCDYCTEQFDRQFSLNRHKQNVHSLGRQRFQCKECGKRFPRQDNLLRHERSHRAEGLRECAICSRGFRSDYIVQHTESCKKRASRGGQRPAQAVLKFRTILATDQDHEDELSLRTAGFEEPAQIPEIQVSFAEPLNGKDIGANSTPHRFEQICLSPICTAAACGDLSTLKHLHGHGQSIRGTNKTPLECASSSQNPSAEEVITYLIEQGAEPNLGADLPLAKALVWGTARNVELLLNAGAYLELVSAECLMSLREAAGLGHEDGFRFREAKKKVLLIDAKQEAGPVVSEEALQGLKLFIETAAAERPHIT